MKNIFWLRTGPKMSKIGQFKGKKGKNVSKICQEIIEIGLLLPLSESKDAALNRLNSLFQYWQYKILSSSSTLPTATS